MSKYFFVSLFFLPTLVDAYIDPGTGSIIFQVILGSMIGAIAIMKIYWNKIMKLFFRNKKDSEKQL